MSRCDLHHRIPTRSAILNMPLSLDEFTQQLTASGLIDAAAVTESLASLPPDKQPQDGEQLARELVRQKKLTKFQAEQLYARKGKSLTLGNYVTRLIRSTRIATGATHPS